MKVKNNLLMIRVKLGYKFGKQFAEYLGVDRSLYYKWETGTILPSLDKALMVSKKLGMSVNEIWELGD